MAGATPGPPQKLRRLRRLPKTLRSSSREGSLEAQISDVPFGLYLVLSHYIGDRPRRTEILDGTSHINCQQRRRLRDWVSYFSVWPYSSKPDLHLCIHVQHPVVAEALQAPDHRACHSRQTG
jgi:hypothetical protein